MLISYQNKFIFIHNPKTGGLSIKEALKNHALINPLPKNPLNPILEKTSLTQHLNKQLRKAPLIPTLRVHDSTSQIRSRLPSQIWKNFYKFGFVRNPWSRVASLYFSAKQNKKLKNPHRLIKTLGSFENFIHWLSQGNYISQKEFFYGENDEPLVDFIGKLENIDKDFQKVLEKINVQTKLPHTNKSKHKNYRTYYTPKTRKLLAEIAKEDIKKFNYIY